MDYLKFQRLSPIWNGQEATFLITQVVNGMSEDTVSVTKAELKQMLDATDKLVSDGQQIKI